MPEKHSQVLKNEAIKLVHEGKTDTEISALLGVSTNSLRTLRRKNNLPPSDGDKKRMYSVEQINDVIDLIREEVPIGEIAKHTGVNSSKIKRIHKDELRQGNPLPNIVKGVAIRSKYSDEELIELAYLNPGYGFRRFVSFLSISEKHCLGLFSDYKDFTNDEEDLYDHLQNETNGTMVTIEDYREITGRRYSPKGTGLSTSKAPGSKRGGRLKPIFLPPQIFNWGGIKLKHFQSRTETDPVPPKATSVDLPSINELIIKDLEATSATADEMTKDVVEDGLTRELMEVNDWIDQTIAAKGYIQSQEDREDFILRTGAGATKFNKWMKRSGLIFNKKSGHWI